MKAIKASTKIMKNLTSEQKQMEREYNRMEKVIATARKGQNQIHRQCALLGTISEKNQAFYDTYQSQIDAAQCRIEQLKEMAKEMRLAAQ